MKIIKRDEEFYCISNKNVDFNKLLNKFLKLAQVEKNSFAELYLKKIYNCMFKGCINVVEKYKKYYECEYDTFEKYLYNKELFDCDEAIKIGKYFNKGYDIYQLKIANNSYNIFGYFKYDENFIKKLNSLIVRLDK